MNKNFCILIFILSILFTAISCSIQPTSSTNTIDNVSISAPLNATAATWYVSTSGSDSNAGTKAAPFKSIIKAQSAASSGDTVYIRGGTYSSFTIESSDSNYYFVHNITKSGITYAGYTGETVIFNFSSVSTSKRVAAFHIASGVTGVVFKNFQIKGVPVGSQKQSECFRVEGSANFELISCHDNAANGFYFTNHGTGWCSNCDSYNNIGPTSTSLGNTDGFGAHGDGVTITGSRAWNCSDDGFDCIASAGANSFLYCWAYNMNAGGDSNGFKIGGWGTSTPPSSVPAHTVSHCLAAKNGSNGFYANHQPGKAATWTYNTAYANGVNYNMLERVSVTDSTDISGTREVLHYNIAYSGTIIANSNNSSSNMTNNSWTKSGVTVSSADFQSTSASQMTKARNSDGSLPTITFMKLVSGSDLAGMGF
jgi:hypothetical protein